MTPQTWGLVCGAVVAIFIALGQHKYREQVNASGCYTYKEVEEVLVEAFDIWRNAESPRNTE